jgi:LysM repeat protein
LRQTLLRGLASATSLFVVLVGLPVGLLTLVGDPLPHQVPTWTELHMAISSGNVPNFTIERVLALVLWCLWAYIFFCAVREAGVAVRAYRSGRPAIWHRPTMGALVGPAISAILVLSARSAPAFAAPMPAAVTATVPAPNRSTTVSGHVLSVIVAPGDTLESIARRSLGNPARWPQIFAANAGRPQPDGRTLSDPHWIYPGWHLVLPSSAATDTAQQTHLVVPGDTLWEIAQKDLGNPARWPQIFAANEGRPQLDGRTLSDPHWIYPGEVLAIPNTSNGAANPPPVPPAPSTHTPPSPAAAPVTAPKAGVTAPKTAKVSSPPPTVRHDDMPVHHGSALPAMPTNVATGPAKASAVPEALGPTPAHHVPKSHSGDVVFAGLVGVSALGLFAARRARKKRARSSDEAGPTPNLAERLANLGPEGPRMEAAMANLAHVAHGLTSLRLLGAELVEDVAEFTLGAPVPPLPEGAKPGRSARLWRVSAIPTRAPLRPCAWPALVAVGESTTGPILVDLEAAGSISLTGDPAMASGLAQEVSTQLATAAHCEAVEVWLVGARLSCPTPRARAVQLDDQALAELRRRAQSTEEWLQSQGYESTCVARLAGEALPTTVVVLGDEPDDATATVLAEVSSPGRSGVTILCVGDSFGARWHWRIEATTTFAPLECAGRPLGTPAPPAPLTESTAVVPQPLGPAPFDLAASVEVRVLGPEPAVEGAASAPMTPGAQHLILFLALHGGTVPRPQWAAAIGAQSSYGIDAVVASAAHALRGPDGDRVINEPDGSLRLVDVTTDWARFRAMVGAGEAARALELVTGRPFSAYDLAQLDVELPWVEEEDVADTIVNEIVATASRLSDIRFAAGDTDGALDAAVAGLVADPLAEGLVRLAMRAAAAQGRLDLVGSLLEDLECLLPDGISPAPETRRLAHQLMGDEQPHRRPVLVPFR